MIEINKDYYLKDGQYIAKSFPKTQIYIHHTAGTGNPIDVCSYWNSNPGRIATAYIIGGDVYNKRDARMYRDGEIFEIFNPSHWAYHLGVKKSQVKGFSRTNNKLLSQHSIGIELCNAGYLDLVYINGIAYYRSPATKRYYPKEEVVYYKDGYRGKKYYQRYTTEQIRSLKKLLVHLSRNNGIDITYKGIDMFHYLPNKKGSPTQQAFSLVNGMSQNGIYTHGTVRKDKFDCHPQKELIEMLESL